MILPALQLIPLYAKRPCSNSRLLKQVVCLIQPLNMLLLNMDNGRKDQRSSANDCSTLNGPSQRPFRKFHSTCNPMFAKISANSAQVHSLKCQ